MHQNPKYDGLTVRAGAAGVIANIILGASSLYWKALGTIPATTLLGYRILVSLATLVAVLAVMGHLRSLTCRVTWRLLSVHAAAAVFVAINWGTFIWASIHGHVIESGLGYLLAPFVAIAVGALALHDKMSRIRIAALAIIVITVIYLLRESGELLHGVYLTIGATWGGYTCLKKWTTLDAFGGLLIETIVLTIMLPLLLMMTSVTLVIPNTVTHAQLAGLALCGVVSVAPLALFSFAAAHLPLSVMGFFQFVLPSTQLVIALSVYRQPVRPLTLACFSVIWLCLMVIIAVPLFSARRIKQSATRRISQ